MSRKRSNSLLSSKLPAPLPPTDPLVSWIDVFPPRTAQDLAVHTQKVDSLRNWLKFCGPNKSSLLLITGPPGCGKSACVRVLAEELGFELHEWLSPVDEEWSKENGFQSQQNKFCEFLFKTSRYQSLFHQKRRLLLVKDFPNILIDQKSVFHEVLGRFKEVGKSPLIFIASETRSKSLNIAFKLFPSEIQSQYSVQNISLNAISTTLMKKALQSLLANLKKTAGFSNRFREPSADVLDSLIVSSQGDIRSAILNLQFVSQKNLPQVSTVRVEETSNKDLNAKRTKRTKDTNKLKEIGRDETISMMHGVGRVLNPKYDSITNRLSHSPEGITEAFATQPNNFLLFLFSNYLPHFATIPDSAECCQSLSKSDFLLAEYRDQALPLIALNVGIRGAMVSNSAPVAGWHPVKGHKMDRVREDGVDEAYGRFIKGGDRNLVTRNTFVMDFKSISLKIQGQGGGLVAAAGGIVEKKTDEEKVFDLDDDDEEEANLIHEIETMDSD